MIKILLALLDSLKAMNPLVTLATGGLTFCIAVFNFFNEVWGVLLTKIAAAVLPTYAASVTIEGLSFVNYFFPIQEFFTFLSAYFVLFLACTAIRIVKSFIPTIA